MLWTSKPKVPEWKVQKVRDYCCAQWFKLKITGNSDPAKGPTHFCPGCGYAFWLQEIKPSAAQILEANKTGSGHSEANMKYLQFKTMPPAVWGTTPEFKMIDQLGGENQPGFLHVPEKKYWRNKYCDKYPNSRLGKLRTQERLEEKERKNRGN